MGKIGKLGRKVGGMLIGVVCLLLLTKMSANAETFTYKGVEYDTNKCDDSRYKSGFNYASFNLSDGASLVYIVGIQDVENYNYVEDIVELFPDISVLHIYFDCSLKGSVSSCSCQAKIQPKGF